MDSFGIFNISASALGAQRERMNVIASNMANVHTTRTEAGGAYRRKDVVFEADPLGQAGDLTERRLEGEGVRVVDVVEDPTPLKKIYDPGHPDADADGYVELPNVNVIEEMVNMMMAVRAYEANVNTFNASAGMIKKTLELGR